MKREQVLEEATKAVTQDRNLDYDEAEDNFKDIAEMWNVYLRGRSVQNLLPHDVAVLMMLVKVSRLKTSPAKADHWVDLAGYAACGGGIAADTNVNDIVREMRQPAPQKPSEAPQRPFVAQPAQTPAPEPYKPSGKRLPEPGDIYLADDGCTYEILSYSDDQDVYFRNIDTHVRFTMALEDWFKPVEGGVERYRLIATGKAIRRLNSNRG